jgi:hypothetical protein
MAEEEHWDTLHPANDNAPAAAAPVDPRILRIAQAIGRQLAREWVESQAAANDNAPSPPSP